MKFHLERLQEAGCQGDLVSATGMAICICKSTALVAVESVLAFSAAMGEEHVVAAAGARDYNFRDCFF